MLFWRVQNKQIRLMQSFPMANSICTGEVIKVRMFQAESTPPADTVQGRHLADWVEKGDRGAVQWNSLCIVSAGHTEFLSETGNGFFDSVTFEVHVVCPLSVSVENKTGCCEKVISGSKQREFSFVSRNSQTRSSDFGKTRY